MKHILLIKDEQYLGLVIQTCLVKLAGWSVLIAESGHERLHKAEAELPDAILLDMMMPDLDGHRVLHREPLQLVPQISRLLDWDCPQFPSLY